MAVLSAESLPDFEGDYGESQAILSDHLVHLLFP